MQTGPILLPLVTRSDRRARSPHGVGAPTSGRSDGVGGSGGMPAATPSRSEENPVKIGVHVPDLTYPAGPTALGADLARIAEGADAAGIDRLSVMDHVWQIHAVGP